jgi:hypothetical protein
LSILAIDLGLRTGLACFDEDGSLLWFRSQNMGNITRLKRAVPNVLDECPDLSRVVLEGDRRLGEIWAKLAEKRGAVVEHVAPEVWREALILPRDRRSGVDAKESALKLAMDIIERSDVRKPRTPLVDDVAEAICIGAWATRRVDSRQSTVDSRAIKRS